jgi:hypothetical protein
MNELDLPPRRELPSEVRDRIRTAVHADTAAPRKARHRAPLAVAASVTVLVAGLIALRPLADSSNDVGAGSGLQLADPVRVGPFTVTPSAPGEDMDNCASVAALSPRSREFAPFEPDPVFTATRRDGDRIIAFRTRDGAPGFCELDSDTATLSDPAGARITMADEDNAQVLAFYLSPSGLLAGVARGVTALEFWGIEPTQGDVAMPSSLATPVFEDDLFVVEVGELAPGEVVEVLGRNSAGASVVTGSFTYDPSTVPPIGATGPFIR